MPDAPLIRELMAQTQDPLLRTLAEEYLALPADSSEALAAALAESLDRAMTEQADATCPA